MPHQRICECGNPATHEHHSPTAAAQTCPTCATRIRRWCGPNTRTTPIPGAPQPDTEQEVLFE